MLKMPNDSDDPSSRSAQAVTNGGGAHHRQDPDNGSESRGLLVRLKTLIKGRPDPSLRAAIEEYIEEPEKFDDDPDMEHERLLLSNILKLKDFTTHDVMVPRADIVALDVETTSDELLKLLAEKQYNRIPVYRGSLDDVLGAIHIKDVLGKLAKGSEINIRKLIRKLPIVSPSMSVLDLLLDMRMSGKHMSLVVDEFGGIDGLVTIGDVIESIIGDIDDEYDTDEQPQIVKNDDGTLTADARVDIDEFEELCGNNILSTEEREESETLGGLVTHMAGRVPARGEVLTHESGTVFEVLDADPRRINRLLIRDVPSA